ncbi:vacuolar protein sorting-associated protein 18 homolog [Patiria miniata]|uniref:Vacuolar protein sorting-associated protein 18 homolog n=1 Tax=Patiria miniata TaxID=46514 RepID=A0A914A678_PATMI|nr:vacuolar protein sorting-associated protein 18 homolog [Patiria miniata]
MASLFDQYEQATARAASSISQGPKEVVSAPITSGYVTAKMEEEVKIFSRMKINFTPPRPITHLVVNNNMLMMAMSDNVILRIDLEHPDQPDEVKLGEYQIHKLFLDPTGRHLIISTEQQEVFYLSRTGRKGKPLQKLKGHIIDSIGWNKLNTSDSTTAEVLMGTSKGLIFETEIQSGDDSRFFQQSLDQYWKQVFNLGKEGAVPVTGLEVELVQPALQNERRFFIMATTPGRLYQFVGIIPSSSETPVFQNVFHRYEASPASFLELPGNFGYSELQFSYGSKKTMPSNFAWMTGPGIYYGVFDFNSQSSDNLTKDSRLLPYPDTGKGDVTAAKPIAMALTEFHVLLLFQDRLKVMCVLNEQLIDEEVYNVKYGKILGVCRDKTRGTIWTFTDQSVFKYKVVKESRDVWRMYLDQGNFDRSKEFCQDNPANLDKVLTRQAEYFFENQKYDKSALYFAMTERSFEEVALKFIGAQQTTALRMFLDKKLSTLRPQEKTQMTMLVMWLIELYLNQLGEFRAREEARNTHDKVHTEFQKFLAQTRVMECLSGNVDTVYDLIASHGDVEDMVFFAMLMKDYERVISHHIQHDDYHSALEVLRKPKDTGLYYKFSPVLMQHIPNELVTAWIDLGKTLDPKKLIPALVQYDHSAQASQVNEAIRYLRFCTLNLFNTEQAIHNYLLSLYAKFQPEELMEYLEQQGDIEDRVHYDLKYALRLCAEHNHKRACVHIYTTMGLYEEAVDLALQVDVDLAKQSAEKPEDDNELKKKLWLRIARHVVEKQSDIQEAMLVLQECPQIKIEDILPFFPDFVTIDHFKDAICNSLADYNEHIESLKKEMEDATDSAQNIRGDIQEVRNKYGIVGGSQKCASCNYPLLTRSFYLFPCQHMFHADCLNKEVLPHLTMVKRTRMSELQRRLSQLQTHRSPASSAPSGDAITKRDELDQIKNELDDITAAECVYCGEIMIKSVDRPFIEPDDYDATIKSWE